MRLERTRAPFGRLTVTQRRGQPLRSPASTDGRCSLTFHARPRARRRGAPRRATPRGSFAELFVEEKTSTSIRLDDGKVEELTTGLDRGAGVRVCLGTSYGYAYSNRLDRDALLAAAEAASAALREGEAGAVVDLRTIVGSAVNPVERPAEALPAADKVAWLRELDDAARSFSPEVTQVVGVYGDSLQRVSIATSDGLWVEESRPRIRLVAQVVAARDGNIQTGFHGPAACSGTEFVDRHPPGATAEVAARRAVTMLDSIPAPAGEMTVVLAPGMGGVLFHEAVGHPLESDAIDKEASVYRGLVGERCASELIDGVDDATIPNGGARTRSTTRPRRRNARRCSRRACCRGCCTTGCTRTRTGSRRRATGGDSRTRRRRSRG